MDYPLLAYEWVDGQAGSKKTVVMLHGILGQKRNLLGFARRFVRTFPQYRVLLADLRNHGKSQGFASPNTLNACADDLANLLRKLELFPRSVIGHSFGAAVALTYARNFGFSLSSLWLLDAVPALSHELKRTIDPQLDRILNALQNCSLAQSGQEFKSCLHKRGVAEPLCAWLAMNLVELNGSLKFLPKPSVAREMMDDLLNNYVVQDLDLGAAKPKLFLVQAERNLAWQGALKSPISELERGGRITVFRLPNSGHWVHVDNPDGILDIMAADFA